MNDVAAAVSIAAVEFRRSTRTLLDETNKLAGILLSALLLAAVTILLAAGLYLFGDPALQLAAEHPRAVRAGFAGVWLGVAAFTTFRTVSLLGAIDGQAGMLTTTSPAAVLGGLVLAEAGRHAAHLLLPGLLLAAALSVGSGQLLAGPALLASLAAVWASALPVGYLLGQCVRYLSRAVPVVRRNRLKLSAVGVVIYVAAVLQVGELVFVFAATPVGWFGDLALRLAVGGGAPLRAAAATAVTVVGVPGTLLVAHRVTVANWYGDPAVVEDDGTATSGSLLHRLTRLLEGVVSRPTLSVTRAVWLRARRSPLTLTYAIVPAFAFAGYLVPALREGRLPSGLPVMVAGYAAWGVGAAFTLNPLGEEGALVPVTVASGISGSSFVRGRMIAAWLPGVAPTAALVAVLGIVVGKSPPAVVLSAIYAVVLALAAPAFSVGIGMALPNFDTQRVMLSREAVVPSVVAFLAFLFILGVVAAPGGLALLFFSPTETVAGVPVAAAGVAATAVAGLFAAVPGYAYAVRAFDRYEVDQRN